MGLGDLDRLVPIDAVRLVQIERMITFSDCDHRTLPLRSPVQITAQAFQGFARRVAAIIWNIDGQPAKASVFGLILFERSNIALEAVFRLRNPQAPAERLLDAFDRNIEGAPDGIDIVIFGIAGISLYDVHIIVAMAPSFTLILKHPEIIDRTLVSYGRRTTVGLSAAGAPVAAQAPLVPRA